MLDGDQSSVHFGFLGPLLIRAGDAGITIRGARLRVLLAVLLARAGHPVTADQLVEFVWDGEPSGGAQDTVRAHLMRLRRALGPDAGARVATCAPGYRLVVSEQEVDALRFARCCQDGSMAFGAGQWAKARTAFADGLRLWRGDPLSDVQSQLLRDAEAPALERLRLQALAPAEWHAQIYRLTEDQLIGLRFASDDEVVALAKQALEHNLSRKQIKERIKSWRADDWRV